MNRLILIGNGFDLAHGLKTSYSDFIKWYLTFSMENALERGYYTDKLIEVNSVWDFRTKMPFKSVKDMVHYFYDSGKLGYLIYWEGLDDVSPSVRYTNPYTTHIKSAFLKKLLDTCANSRWVDIENEYYLSVKAILKTDISTSDKEELLMELNNSFEFIIELLEKYLSTMAVPRRIAQYRKIFESKILKEDIVTSTLEEDIGPRNTMILNFNYTQTANQYLGRPPALANYSLNHIHGTINDIKNPLIFGFGDELDSDYAKIELEKAKGYLTFFKSFWYFRTSNYHNLIRFINADEYQVYILGHSCGLSDRTLLNMIFESTNCKSIKIFYYKNTTGNNFKDIAEDISRHFTNKAEMRNKIVPLEKSEPMPQHKPYN
ncbi:AbiH family protein [Pedobacter sp. SYSU D00535]|uniref:AbiH family protein n=1 Tax=Pedobacter sp. SYSU D00535 TaxID=2810308 RepID=UPI001A96D26D|nr:AbiH family protein [Pedobacter sp. SYSU D00535]